HCGKARCAISSSAYDEPRGAVVDRAKHERAPALEHERAAGHDLHHAPAETAPESPAEVVGRSGAHEIAGRDALPLRKNAIGVVDWIADESLQPIVAIEARAILADLGEPRPHCIGAGVD